MKQEVRDVYNHVIESLLPLGAIDGCTIAASIYTKVHSLAGLKEEEFKRGLEILLECYPSVLEETIREYNNE